MTQTPEDLFEALMADAAQPFAGWDFAYFSDTGRMATAPLPWGYVSQVLPRLRQAQAALDMGTGGGELLARLRPFPPRMCATEGYAPNVPLARARLEPLGVQVAQIDADDRLPYDAGAFDLVINRHESYVPAEVARVLRPGGWFLTQQVGGENDVRLNQLLGAPRDVSWQNWRLATAVRDVVAAGLQVVEQQEAFPVTRFYDIGAVVYYLRAIAWQVPDFGVERYRDELWRMHQLIQADGYLEVTSHRFFMCACAAPGG